VDVVSGLSGSVLGLLAIESQDVTFFRERARAFTYDILNRARRENDALFWSSLSSSGLPDKRPLTGFAHGASGIGAALLAEYQEPQEIIFKSAAEAAFQYEENVFDRASGKYPDLRGTSPSFSTGAWCTGSPGIALSRLLAMQFDPASRLAHSARAELPLLHTAEAVALALESNGVNRSDGVDGSLCHGLSGLAEICLFGSEIRGEIGLRDLATRAAKMLMANRFRSGLPEGDWTPGLMVGSAGFGHLLLRLAFGTDVPSPLVGYTRIKGNCG